MFGICLPNYYICHRNEKKIKQVNINLTIFKEMNKKLFFLAIAALGLAACSNDDVVEINQSLDDTNSISFRPLTNGLTRATEKTAFVASDVINVWATKGGSAYFNNVTFTFAAEGYSGFSSNPPYYWPTTVDASTNKMVFYSTYEGTQTSAGNISSFSPAAAAASQKDLLCSKLECESKPAAGEAVLAFKHALSEIIVQAKNSNENLKITVSKVKVGYIAKTGALNFTTGSPVWTNTNPTNTATDIYSQVLTSDLELTADAAALTGTSAWMILPQNLALSQAAEGAMVYTKAYKTATQGTASSDANLNCAYIALELLFQDATTDATVVAKQWCYWPITTTWAAGHKYTYLIDAAQGGYQPTNVDVTEATTLDEVLGGLEIRFKNTSSIEAWVTESTINVAM